MENRDNLEILFEITGSILTNLKGLEELENDGAIDSKEYRNLVMVIQNQLELEKSILEKICLNKNELRSYLGYLTKSNQIKFTDNFDSIKSDDFKELVNRRIINMLNEKNTLPELDALKTFGIDFNSLKRAKDAVDEDLINTILYILNEYITNPKYKNIQKELITYKYNIAFLNNSILINLLDKKFIISSPLYWAHLLFYNDNTKAQIAFSKEIGALELLKNYSELLIEEKNPSLIVLYQSLVRSALLMLPKETFEELKGNVQDILNELQKIAVSMEPLKDDAYLACFEYYKKDIEKPNILSLRL